MKTQKIGKEQAKDTGMAMVLICLLIQIYHSNTSILAVTIILLLVCMTVPKVYIPFAIIWFGFSNMLGTIMTKVLLTALFFIIVSPIGLLRKALGSDSLKLKEWKKGTQSVFEERNHQYHAKELEQPF